MLLLLLLPPPNTYLGAVTLHFLFVCFLKWNVKHNLLGDGVVYWVTAVHAPRPPFAVHVLRDANTADWGCRLWSVTENVLEIAAKWRRDLPFQSLLTLF